MFLSPIMKRTTSLRINTQCSFSQFSSCFTPWGLLACQVNKDNADTMSGVVEPMIGMMEHEEGDVANIGSMLVQQLSQQQPQLLAPVMDRLLTLLLDNEIQSVMRRQPSRDVVLCPALKCCRNVTLIKSDLH